MLNAGHPVREMEVALLLHDGWSFRDPARRSASLAPTRRLDRPPASPAAGYGLSGALPRIPRTSTTAPDVPADARQHIQRRRRLLAIFARLMDRFYAQHERRLSAGRFDCTLCRRRILAWAWAAPLAGEFVHEACVSRSVWHVVLAYERAAAAGYAPDVAGDLSV